MRLKVGVSGEERPREWSQSKAERSMVNNDYREVHQREIAARGTISEVKTAILTPCKAYKWVILGRKWSKWVKNDPKSDFCEKI